jgi:hypothetical protein
LLFSKLSSLFHHGSISPTNSFFSQTRWEAFLGEWHLANGESIWWISLYILGKFHRRRMLVKLNGNFLAKRCAPATFCLAHKGWWNWPKVCCSNAKSMNNSWNNNQLPLIDFFFAKELISNSKFRIVFSTATTTTTAFTHFNSRTRKLINKVHRKKETLPSDR